MVLGMLKDASSEGIPFTKHEGVAWISIGTTKGSVKEGRES